MSGNTGLRKAKNNSASRAVIVPDKSRRPRLIDSVETRQAKGRSKITNGTQLLPNIDLRNIWVRRFKDVIGLHLSDLGGSDNVSEAEKSIVRRVSAITVELEQLERKFALNGGATALQLEGYQRGANTLRRLLQTLGLQRRQRNVTPSLSEYLRDRPTIDDVDVEEIDDG